MIYIIHYIHPFINLMTQILFLNVLCIFVRTYPYTFMFFAKLYDICLNISINLIKSPVLERKIVFLTSDLINIDKFL